MPAVKSQVELLRYTAQPEEIVAMGARLCYSDADIETLRQGVSRRDQGRYIEKLVDMGHLSPIEHASFTFGIEGVSRSLLAQITRHRIASFSVKSQRYVGAVGKGGDTFNYVVPAGVKALGPEAVARFERQMRTIQGWYDEWVKEMGGGGEKTFEDARFVLPNAAETKMIVTMNARELHHFFSLRCCNRAQWEIREVAWTMLGLAKKAAPNLFRNAGPGCVAGACTEGAMSCGRADEVLERMRRDFPD
ncbi:MAG: FAD-dependent thymidylate synthase [Christensenellales bacterium]|jgi:thymidylate synthase (FAD)